MHVIRGVSLRPSCLLRSAQVVLVSSVSMTKLKIGQQTFFAVQRQLNR